MSRNGKILLGILVGMTALCVCCSVTAFALLAAAGSAAYQTVETSPAAVPVLTSSIADFDLPEGYGSEAALNLGPFQFVSFAPAGGRGHIILVQASPSLNVDAATLERFAQQAEDNRGYNPRTRSRVVAQKVVTIRGQAVTMVMGEGTNAAGEAYRTMSGVFQGRNGIVFVGIEQPVSAWNQAAVDSFLASIR